MRAADIDYKALVEDGRIHASLYTDPRVFADEKERIFRRGWVFVGHDSRTVSHVTDETTNRGFWRHYRAVMTDG